MSTDNQHHWYNHKAQTLRRDVHDALIALRDHVENINRAPSIILTPHSTLRFRDPGHIMTLTVGEWCIGYRIETLNEQEGFFVRSVFVRLLGGRLTELNEREREQIIYAITESVMDRGTDLWLERISDSSFVIHQPFAVMYHHEKNPNIVVPSKELLNQAFDPFRQIKADSG
jgi:hypothetical protein